MPQAGGLLNGCAGCKSSPPTRCQALPGSRALQEAARWIHMTLEMCACWDGRIHAVAQVPLQDIDASCREVERARPVSMRVHRGPETESSNPDSDQDRRHSANLTDGTWP